MQGATANAGFWQFYPNCGTKRGVRHILTVMIWECGANGASLVEIRSVVWAEAEKILLLLPVLPPLDLHFYRYRYIYMFI